MPRRTSIRADIGVEEVERRYRAARDPVARSHWQSVWLLAQGEPSERVRAVTGYSLTWVRTVARRYNAGAEQGIGDRCHANRGGTRLLTPEQEAALDQALEGAAPGGGRWTAAKVADVDEPAAWATGGRRDRLALSASARLAAVPPASAARQS